MAFFLPFEIIGTIAFAISGASVGLKKDMDILGVSVLGMTTAVGGGILRDLILNIAPPSAFQDPVFAFIAIAASIALFLFDTRGKSAENTEIYDTIILIADSVGLALFTVLGMRISYSSVAGPNNFLAIFVGVVTGVGGGVLRDILAGETPYIFVKHFYACASIIGAVIFALSRRYLGEFPSMMVGAGVIFILRILAAHYRWNLPKSKGAKSR